MSELLDKYHIITSVPLVKGWSRDQKYILVDEDGRKYLLRISTQEYYERKKAQFDLLRKIASLEIYSTQAIEFGVFKDGSVYMLLSYLEGIDGEEAIDTLNDQEAYALGIEAGKILHQLHSIEVPKQEHTWWERYQTKMYRKIEALQKCQYTIPNQEKIIQYYQEHWKLMQNRPVVFTHGDYHLGNMIVHNGNIGIIDFDKANIADPYDDFKPFCWNVRKNAYFETGLIDGYFAHKIPNDFWKILKFYTAESLISQLPWSVSFGKEEIQTALEVAKQQMLWYGDFELEIPTWYKGSDM